MKKRLLFIYNPHSGKGVIKANLSDIVDIFIKAGFEVTVYSTQGTADATKRVMECGDEFDRIVCAGGDGTLNEVIEGIMMSGRDHMLGYIPVGSTNDFGSSLGLVGSPIRAAKIASGSVEHLIDVGRFNDKYFVYVAAFGIFTEVSYSTNQEYKNFFGHAAYIIEAIKSLQDIPSVSLRVEADGRVIHGDFIYGMITNSRQVGGLKDFIKGDIFLDDGLFEVMLIKSPTNPIELTDIISFLSNIKKESDMVYSFQASSVKLTSKNPLAWTLDGEFGGKVETAVIGVDDRNIHMLGRG